MCMGRTHTLSTGALALACAAPLSAQYLHHSMNVGTLFVFALVTAGFGLLPDIDHPSSTLAHAFGPATKQIAEIVGRVSGGHRKATHTIWFAAGMVALVDFVMLRGGRVADWVIAGIGIYLMVLVLRIVPRRRGLSDELARVAVSAAAVVAYQVTSGNWWWLGWAVGFGVIGHVLGDLLTTEGCPILYPLLPHFVLRVPVLGSTDHWREHVFAALLVPAICWLVLAAVTGNDWATWSWFAHPGTWHVLA